MRSFIAGLTAAAIIILMAGCTSVAAPTAVKSPKQATVTYAAPAPAHRVVPAFLTPSGAAQFHVVNYGTKLPSTIPSGTVLIHTVAMAYKKTGYDWRSKKFQYLYLSVPLTAQQLATLHQTNSLCALGKQLFISVPNTAEASPDGDKYWPQTQACNDMGVLSADYVAH